MIYATVLLAKKVHLQIITQQNAQIIASWALQTYVKNQGYSLLLPPNGILSCFPQ